MRRGVIVAVVAACEGTDRTADIVACANLAGLRLIEESTHPG